MPKRRSRKPAVKSFEDTLPDVDETVNPEDEDYYYDSVDKFHQEKERLALETTGNESEESSDEEEEVLGVAGDTSSEEEEEEEEEEEGEEDDDDCDEEMMDGDDLPGVISNKAWGKKRSTYYGTDKLDGLEGFDRDEAQDMEEEEARKMQSRLLAEIDVSKFQFKKFSKPTTKTTTTTEESSDNKMEVEKVETDVSSLSKEEQWKLLYQQSPEIEPLKKNFIHYYKQGRRMKRLLQLVRLKRVNEAAGKWIVSRHKQCMIYCLMVNHYFTIIAQKISLENHEIVADLADIITRLKEGDATYEKFESQFNWLLQDEQKHLFESSDESSDEESEVEELSEAKSHIFFADDVSAKKRRKINSNKLVPGVRKFTMEDKLKLAQQSAPQEEVVEVEDEDENRRGINRQIAKNTGYKVSKRRKLDRNPRVKHREKHRRAIIRRKGQVKTHKPEINKYSGEHSGIREGVIRSIRLKN